jgi:signal transduction histidine kinase
VSRLFLRLYITLAVVLAVVIGVTMFAVRPSLFREQAEDITRMLRGPVAMATRGGDVEAAKASLSETFGWSVREVDASPDLLARLAAGQGLVADVERAQAQVYATVGDRVVALGPFQVTMFAGGGRGPLVWGVQFGGLAVAILAVIRPLDRRLTRVAEVAQALGRGELDARADMAGDDGVADLARALNGMADRVKRLLAAHEELLGAVGHELRTPMTRIRYALELLPADTPGTAERIRHMEEDLGELDALVGELMAWAAADAAVADTRRFEAIDLGTLLRVLAGRAAIRPGLAIEVDVDEPGPVVLGNPHLIARALQNLLVNAVKYSAARVRVSVEVAGREVTVCVDDDGPGVPVAERERIFEPFTRMDAARARDAGGAGLGLAIVRRVAQSHRARVWVTSSPLGGARFAFALAEVPEPQEIAS